MTENGGFTLDHVADVYRRYPGEALRLFTRVTAPRAIKAYVVSVTLPENAILDTTTSPHANQGPRVIRWPEGGRTITWLVNAQLDAGEAHEFEIHATVAPAAENTAIVSSAFLRQSEDSNILAQESLSVSVFAKGSYLRHLPSIYEGDDMMGRFLMLFESFWHPIEARINQMPYFFDPHTAPPDLLPWLASGLDLTLDPRWPEKKRRQLLRSIVKLYRTRGTRHGLSDYLEIYTGIRPQIVEHRASNFTLGVDSRLGQGLALGTQNAPHTFSVTIELPELPEREARQRQSVIERIIESEKPAHTAYELCIKDKAANT